jgi:chemotaxis protein histidine kinase CheA
MKGMEGRAGKKTVYSDRMEEEIEGYAADVSMADGKEEVATPVKQAQQFLATAASGPSTDKTTPSTKQQKQTKSNATPAKSAETPTTSARSHKSTRPRFTAPSALEALPANMFVTSVYFPWPHGKNAIREAKNTAREEQQQDTSFAVEDSVMEVDEEAIAAAKPAAPSAETNALTRVPAGQTERERKRRAYLLGKEYVAPEDRHADDAEHAEEEAVDAQIHGSLHNGNGQPQSGESHVTVTDWERAEQSWDELKVVAADNLEQLVEGTILAWKVSDFQPVKRDIILTGNFPGSGDGLHNVHARDQSQAWPGHHRQTLRVRNARPAISDSRPV